MVSKPVFVQSIKGGEMLKGAITAMITPFKETGELDEEGLRKNIRFQIENGISGIAVCVTTSEAPALTEEEYRRVIEIAVEEAKGKVPIIAGTGTNNTDKTIKMTNLAKEIGADYALVVVPYYNKPTQEGLYRHYKKVAEETDLPIIIYNVPGRTGREILPQTIARLSEIKNICAVKQAMADLDKVTEIMRLCGDKITLLSGEDSLTFYMLSAGGKGVISVLSNLLPKEVSEMVNAFLEGNIEKARELHFKLYPLFKVMFIETNPIPIKAAMKLCGMPAGDPRLPLAPISETSLKVLKEELKKFGLI